MHLAMGGTFTLTGTLNRHTAGRDPKRGPLLRRAPTGRPALGISPSSAGPGQMLDVSWLFVGVVLEVGFVAWSPRGGADREAHWTL